MEKGLKESAGGVNGRAPGNRTIKTSGCGTGQILELRRDLRFRDFAAGEQVSELRFYGGLQQQLFKYQSFNFPVALHIVTMEDE